MKQERHERGQALIMISVSAIVLFGFAALAIDGSRKFSDRRHAQNAADAAAMAAALASSRGSDDADSTTKAVAVTTLNGYDGGANNDVAVTITAAPAGVCPPDTEGKDIKVDIVSTIGTTFARVIHFNQLTNNVSATARECGSFIGPPFNGNAIVSLAPSGRGFDGTGTPDWLITGGGIFANSADGDAAYCNGAAGITTPSVTVVGGMNFRCHGPSDFGTTDDSASQYRGAAIRALLPREPACNGRATLSGGQWHPQSGADGSQVAFDNQDDMNFAPGLYCVTNSGRFVVHGTLSGLEVTFYIMQGDFRMAFAGGGNLTARAPTSDTNEYKGVLIYAAPQFDASGNLTQTQSIDLRGNGSDNITGTIIVPSADVTMFGNSTSANFDSQIIAYHVDSGGNANIDIKYKINHNYQAALPISLTLLK